MRILLVHNFYSSGVPSGENQVFTEERALLQRRGHELFSFTRASDSLDTWGRVAPLVGGALTAWNPSAFTGIRKYVDQQRPEVVHVHNTFPLLSPAIFHAVGRRAPKVLTLHNYRLFCPAAIPMRDGTVCTKCLDQHSVRPALQYGCYRNSRISTVPLAFSVALHRLIGTWQHYVDAFIALSDFQRSLMISAGLPSHKVHVKPNFYPGLPAVKQWAEREPYVVFAGRLTAEKGVRALLQAWQAWGEQAPCLRIVGDGELRGELELMARGLPVRFLGQLSAQQAQEQIAGARLLALPSECFEGFPMVVREAFAFGTPVVASNLGPLPHIVEHGVSGQVFEPASPTSLLAAIKGVWETDGRLEYLAQGARRAFEEKYTEEANYQALMAIYDSAIQVSKHG